MIEDEVFRNLPELTGRHRCIGCLGEVGREEYFSNDFMCNECAARAEQYPLATTPHAPQAPKPEEDGGETP